MLAGSPAGQEEIRHGRGHRDGGQQRLPASVKHGSRAAFQVNVSALRLPKLFKSSSKALQKGFFTSLEPSEGDERPSKYGGGARTEGIEAVGEEEERGEQLGA